MIPGTATIRQVPAWQAELARAVTEPTELLQLLGLGQEWQAAAEAAARCFPLRVPRGFVARMQRGNPHDPLLRQVLPLAEELGSVPGYSDDPVGDLAALRAPGVLQKYHGRVLLTATGACAVHCRYCFRRHFPYHEAQASADHWSAALAHIAADPDVEEVILSGGDPLTLSDRRLQEFIQTLTAISHVRRLRLHTRLPIVLPERVTPELCAVLNQSRLATVIVVHANHANEIDSTVRRAFDLLAVSGVVLLNQSVLLRGVNNTPETLADLSQALFNARVLPYYLHLLDRVHGAAHFEVSEDEATQLLDTVASRLPGYLVPRLVREVAGAAYKQPL
jgi:EF-P beta-lysylation protein EpmB